MTQPTSATPATGTYRLTEEQLLSWLGVLNDLRLVLGTRLEIDEEWELAWAASQSVSAGD
mgnify:CR=1 FL=1